MKSLFRTLLFVLSIHLVSAKTPLTPAEVSAIEVTAKAFGEAFKDNNTDDLRKLLIPHTLFADIVPDSVIGENTYNDLIAANLARFNEWRGTFADLKKYDLFWKITVIPGERYENRDWSFSEPVIHNTFVELAYANRIKITLKLEDVVVAGGKCYILKID